MGRISPLFPFPPAALASHITQMFDIDMTCLVGLHRVLEEMLAAAHVPRRNLHAGEARADLKLSISTIHTRGRRER